MASNVRGLVTMRSSQSGNVPTRLNSLEEFYQTPMSGSADGVDLRRPQSMLASGDDTNLGEPVRHISFDDSLVPSSANFGGPPAVRSPSLDGLRQDSPPDLGSSDNVSQLPSNLSRDFNSSLSNALLSQSARGGFRLPAVSRGGRGASMVGRPPPPLSVPVGQGRGSMPAPPTLPKQKPTPPPAANKPTYNTIRQQQLQQQEPTSAVPVEDRTAQSLFDSVADGEYEDV